MEFAIMCFGLLLFSIARKYFEDKIKDLTNNLEYYIDDRYRNPIIGPPHKSRDARRFYGRRTKR